MRWTKQAPDLLNVHVDFSTTGCLSIAAISKIAQYKTLSKHVYHITISPTTKLFNQRIRPDTSTRLHHCPTSPSIDFTDLSSGNMYPFFAILPNMYKPSCSPTTKCDHRSLSVSSIRKLRQILGIGNLQLKVVSAISTKSKGPAKRCT